MGLMNSVKSGADLTHPRASVGWVVGAIVAILVLSVALAAGLYLYGKGKAALSGAVKSGGIENQVKMEGWL